MTFNVAYFVAFSLALSVECNGSVFIHAHLRQPNSLTSKRGTGRHFTSKIRDNMKKVFAVGSTRKSHKLVGLRLFADGAAKLYGI